MDKDDLTQPQKTFSKIGLFDWQKKLMWWMILIPSVLIGIFIYLSTKQLNKFDNELNTLKISELDKSLVAPYNYFKSKIETKDMEYIKWYTLAKMEEISLNKRYNQAGILLMARIFTMYLGFFTGMVLAVVGSVFIISKLNEDVSKITGTVTNQMSIKLVSSSPGIIFSVLGTILMLSTILHDSQIAVKEMPMYLNQNNIPYIGRINIAVRPTIDSTKIINLPERKTKKSLTDKKMDTAKP